MSFTIINELDYKTTGPRIVEKNKVAVFKNTQGNIIGENTENIKINNGIEICNENNTGSIILEPSSSSTISQTLTFPATEGNSGQILQNDGSGQLSWVNNGGGGSGDVEVLLVLQILLLLFMMVQQVKKLRIQVLQLMVLIIYQLLVI
jgi:hypothetical protein